MKYCFRCGKDFKRKCNLNLHLQIKNVCPARYLNIDRDAIHYHYYEYEQEFLKIKFANMKNNVTSISHGDASLKEDTIEEDTSIKHGQKKYDCPYCGKSYDKINSRNAHVSRYCKEKNKETNKKKEMEAVMKKMIEENNKDLYEKLKQLQESFLQQNST